MDKQPFARWSADMISDFQLNIATAGLRRAMFIASSQVGDNKYRALIAWLTYLAQGSQDTTTVSNEFQSVALAASVVAVWRVVCQEPTEKGAITEALAYIKNCDPQVVDAEDHTDSFLWAFVTEACDCLYLGSRSLLPL